MLNASIIGENRVHQRPLKPAVHLKNCGATAAAAAHPSEHPGSSEREEEIAREPVAASQLVVASTGSAEQVRGAVSIALSAKQRHIGRCHITLGCVTQSIGPFLIKMWLV